MLKKLLALRQKLSPNSQQIVGNTAWLLGDKVLRMGLGLVVGVWVARYLGPEDFGLLNYAIAFVSLFSTFATLGLNNIIVREVVRNLSAKDEIIGTAFVLKLLGGLSIFILTFSFIYLLKPDENQTQFLVAIISISMIFRAFDVIEFWFQSQLQSKHIIIAKTSGYLLLNLVKIIAVKMQASISIFAGIWSAEIVLGAVGLIIVYQWQGHLLKAWSWSLERAKFLLVESWPLILSGVVIMIYMRTDQIMLGEMIGDSAVGIYSATVRVSEMWYLIPNTLVQSVFPKIVQAKEISKQVYYERLQQLFYTVAALSYSFTIPITFFSTQIMTLIYGENYAAAGPVFSIHIWSGLFVSLGVARGPWLITEGFTKFAAAATATGAIVNVILNYFLIPKYGTMGAAIATVMSQVVASYICHLFVPQTRIIFIQQTKALLPINFLIHLVAKK
ncbi:MAG: flippase [Microcoleaceae cyanobacterium]